MKNPHALQFSRRLALSLCALVPLACASLDGIDSSSTTLYFGGPIITVDDALPLVEAVAVQDGRILAVGSKAEVLAQAQGPVEMVDLGGRTLIPGFIDPHCHFAGFGAQAVGANLLAAPDGSVQNIDDLVRELKAFAEGPDVVRTGWIFGMGYDNAVLEEGRHPTRDDLDRVSTELPVMAVHISGHFTAVNSAGLVALGYDANSTDPEGGLIRRKTGSRVPNGVLEELASIPNMMRVLSPGSQSDQEYYLERGEQLAKSFGYTTAHEGRALAENHQVLANHAAEGGFDIDVVSYIDYSAIELLNSELHSRKYVDRYRIAGLKVTLDGSPQGRTAWRTVPYLIPPDGQEAGYCGYPAIPDDAVVADLFDKAYRNDWQLLVHANGDAAIDQMIRVLESVEPNHPTKDRRHVLVHGQFVRQDQLDSLARLKVIPSLFPLHTFYWGDWYDKIIGPELAQTISPLRSALNRGMIATSHTDAPVARPNLLGVMDATVNRTSRSGKVMGPGERLTPLEALKAITLWGAYQHFEEDRKGSITPGKLADLVILSDNPLAVEHSKIGQIRVLETIKEGRTIYKAE